MYFSPSSQKSVTTVWSSGRCRRNVFAASMCAPELGPTKMPWSWARRRISASASSLETLTNSQISDRWRSTIPPPSYRYWPVFVAVSIARPDSWFFPVTRVRM